MKHAGDPSPRSPVDVTNDQVYRVVEYEGSCDMSGVESWYVVVFHCGTETYWATRCLSANLSRPAQWHQVEPGVETTRTWRKIGTAP